MWDVITLSKEAVIKDPVKKLEHAMLCFFFSKHSQSRLFQGRISSLTKIFQENTDSPENLKTNLETKLTEYLERFFPRAEVIAGIEYQDESESAMVVTLNINVFNVEGSSAANINAGYALTQQSSHLREILDTINKRKIL